MKSNVVAMATAGLFVSMAAHAQSSVTLYGSLDAGVAYVNNAEGGRLWQQSNNFMSDNYFGLRGTEDLGDGLSAVFKLESGFDIGSGGLDNGKGNLFGREAYVGLGSKHYGTLTLGRQYDSAADYLSPLALSGQINGVNLASHYGDLDNVGGTFSTHNVVKFSSANFNGLSFGAMYGFGNTAGSFQNGQMWGAGVGYEAGPVKAALAYVDRRNGSSIGASGDNPYPAGRERVIGGGLGYAAGPVGVGVLYTHTQLQNASGLPGGTAGTFGNHAEFDNIEGNVTYSVNPALTLVGSYTYTRISESADNAKAKPKVHTVVLGADYSLSRRTDFYLASAYQRTSGKQILSDTNSPANPIIVDGTVGTSIAGAIPTSSTNSQVVVGLGVRHRF